MTKQTQHQTSFGRLTFWRRKNLARGAAVLGVLAGVATGTWAVEETAKLASLGLRGIFPSAAPADLSAEEFARLDGNWAAWSKGAAEAVSDFYAKLETADAPEQLAALKVLKAKLDVMERAINDPRYKSILAPLTLMHARLAQRVDLAEGALSTLELDPQKVRGAKLAESGKSVTAAVDALSAYLASVPNGQLWFPYVKADAVKKGLAADPASEETITTVRDAKARIAGRSGLSNASQKEFLGRAAFLRYEEALNNYLTASGWQPPEPNEAELRKQLKALLDATDGYAVSRSSEDAGKVRAAFDEVCKVAADGGDRLSAVLQRHLFNYNVRIVATEEFLNRMMSEARTEKGPVVDFILGANVSGNQTTATRVTFDLRPSTKNARFDLTLNGTIQSSTVGVTSEATVYTQGNHTFVAKKAVTFDGVKFATGPGIINVNPHNTTTGIATAMSGGLFGGIAQSVASREVEARRGAAEAIAASRVRDRVLPKFNSEVDKNFSDASGRLEKEVFSGLKETGLYPDAFVYQSTESTLNLDSRLMNDKELGADLPVTIAPADRGATLMMHETAVNNTIDRIGLAGQTVTEPQLREKLEAFFSKALNKEVKLSPPPKIAKVENEAKAEEEDEDDKGTSSIVFANTDPIRVQFENGELVLVLRAGFKQEGKDDIPAREITVPITFEIKNDKIFITRGSVRVLAAGGEGGGIAINGVVRKKIQNALPDREVDTKVEIKGPKATVTTNVSSIKLLDGWVHISVN